MNKLKQFFIKYKEYILYVVFGAVTTLVNYGFYTLCYYPLKLSGGVSNIVAWVFSMLVAFVTNKIWVFDSKSWEIKLTFKELGGFALGRALTGIFETAAIAIFVDALHQNALVWKIVTSIIVVIVNYIVSKLIVFKKKKDKPDKAKENKENDL